MSAPKSMPSLSDSNIYTAPNKLPDKAPSTTTTWVDNLCPPSQRSEANTFVAVRQFSGADRSTRSNSANCEVP
jgi:hypothetical protein